MQANGLTTWLPSQPRESIPWLSKSDGTVWAWGLNGSGQLGNGTNTDSYIPVQVSGLAGVVAMPGGYFHSLALKSDGTVLGVGAQHRR